MLLKIIDVTSKWLKDHNISNRLSDDIQERVRTVTLIGIFPLVVHSLLAFFCWFQQNYSVAAYCVFNSLISCVVLLFAFQRKVLTAKTLLMCINTLAIFIYINQFDIAYNIFCYIFPLIFALFVLFDFKTELSSFYLVAGFVLASAAVSFFLPPYFFGRLNLPESQKHFFAIFNIILAAIIVVVFLAKLVKITVQTERKLQKALEAVEEAANVKTTFLRNMSHELRTPLNGITGTANILLGDTFLPVQEPSLLNLKHLSEHMTALVNDILDFSKIDADSLELYAHRFNLKELFDKIAAIFSNTFSENGVAFRLDIDERLGRFDLFADEMRLQQILYNLISNAAKFTEQGSVTLMASIVNQTDSEVNLYISVVDTGIGIAPEKTTDIFKSFRQGDAATTRKYGGTGLGLTISNNLVQLFGGNLQVTSVPGKGSTFYMNLTMEKYQAYKHDRAPRQTHALSHLANIKILLAEDNPINMLVATKALEKVAANITPAENGRIAVDKFKEGDFHIVLLDLEMPQMDGRAAFTEIKKINPDVPIIAFTAAFYENMQEELLGFGFADYLLKPFKPDDLYQKIAALV
jgi:signal transduction histidine kinase/CheY-like chemotaxis protein